MSEFEIQALLLSIKVAVTAIIIGMPVALGMALLLTRKPFAGQFLLSLLVHAPLVLPPVVVGYVLLLVFAPTSAFGSFLSNIGLNPAFTWWAAAIASFVMAMPLMVRALMQAIDSIPRSYAQAAATLGTPPIKQFCRITLPLMIPGIRTALILGFARALGEFGATITFAANIPGLTRTLPLALYTASQSPNAETEAMRLAVLCLIPAILSLAASEYMTRKSRNGKSA